MISNRMNFKRSTTSMAIALMVLSLISVTAIQQDAFAQKPQQGMEITATSDKGSDTIMIMGQTISDLTDVTLTVVAPNGNVVTIDQISPDNGIFETVFKVGPTWSEDGFYTITAMQSAVQNSLYTLSVEVEVINGMVASNTSVTESTLETGIILAYSYPKDTRDKGLEINAEAEMGSDIIEITGMTDRVSTDVTLTVVAPNGNVVTIDQVSPADNGEFTSVITTGGPLWTQDGIYTVTAKQFDDFAYTASTEVDIKDGLVVPEFGTIAAMILAVAIVSIIAVSAKSRLSIMPRY